MKTAIYIEDGLVQLVLTPESTFEKNALAGFKEKGEASVQIFRGTFYDCSGGWNRWRKTYPETCYGSDQEDHSIIIRTAVPTNQIMGDD